jgi:predicted GIY-YIG superfamily endonuclease
MTAYRVYVLRNAQDRHYIGMSNDPEKRLAQHNTGSVGGQDRTGRGA